MLWACVLLPSLALDGALRSRPRLTQPFALIHGPAQQRTLIAVNDLARAARLHPGQRLAEAEAVCRSLLSEEHVPRRLESDLGLIAAWAYRYSSEVALDPPHAVVLEIGKSLGLFGPWAKFEARLRKELAGLGFCHRIALAPTPRAAKVLARTHDGACITDPGGLQQALAHIPIVRADLPPDAGQALPGMGIRTLGQLFGLPRAALQRRFGESLVNSIDVLLGRVPQTLVRYQPPPRFDTHIELPAEVSQTQGLLFPLRRMLADLAAFVVARDGGVQRFVVRFGHADAAPTDLTIGLLAPERDAAALLEVTKLRLEQVRLAQPVLELGVHADALPSLVPPGRDLFDARPAHALPWETLRERLRARLGEDAVHGIVTDPDPRPERASMRVGADESPANEPTRLPARPTWLMARPIPLRGPPPRILAGPERLETGWWDGGDIRRDYYVVELATGQRAWAFSPPGEQGNFMLHGWFA